MSLMTILYSTLENQFFPMMKVFRVKPSFGTLCKIVFFQGFELEEQDSDYERKLQLQRVAEEWDNILGRSQEDNHDLGRPSEETTAVEWVTEANVESSNDSMRTMFSNSVNLQAANSTAKAAKAAEGSGRLCEVSNNNKSATMDTASSPETAEAASGRPSSALRLRHCQ